MCTCGPGRVRYAESYCGVVVDEEQVWRRRHATRDFEPLSPEEVDALRCEAPLDEGTSRTVDAVGNA